MIARVLFLTILCLFSGISSLDAYDARPRCFRKIERTFFEPSTVMLALKLYKAPQGMWNLIARELNSRNSRIPGMMRDHAKKMRPNPLENPFDDDAAIKLLRRVTREIFMETMRKYQPVVERDWERIFSYIFDFELERIEQCLGT